MGLHWRGLKFLTLEPRTLAAFMAGCSGTQADRIWILSHPNSQRLRSGNARPNPHAQGSRIDAQSHKPFGVAMRIAVIGAGISGLSAAWLLSRRHDVTLYEAEPRLGGHAQTVDAGVAVDVGFIVYNEPNYPNFTALMDHLGVASQPTHMSFAVSLRDGDFEYSTTGLRGLFAQKRNLASPRFWRMLRDIRRFHATAPAHLPLLEGSLESLGDYLAEQGYGEAFRHAHLLPQGAAIWSSSIREIAEHPAAAFIRFYANHRLLEIDTRPTWRTVRGGSRAYVERLAADFRGRLAAGRRAAQVIRSADEVVVMTDDGERTAYDEVVLAVHADQALRLLSAPTPEEQRILSAIRYRPNRVVLHRDERLMPRRRAAWAAWNHVEPEPGRGCVTYWMNRLQHLQGPPLLVSLNPSVEPRAETVLFERRFDHPVFDSAALAAQAQAWSVQGLHRTWFCGAWFGAGFHEDGLQAGLAVAEQLGAVRRPWSVEAENGRISVFPRRPAPEEAAA